MARPTEIAGKAVGKVKAARQAITGGAGIFERLADEHGQVLTLMRRVAVTGTDSKVRGDLFPKIRIELSAHAKAEEKAVYSVFRTLSEVAPHMDKSVADHETMLRTIEQLHHMSMGDERWIEVFRDLLENLTEHLHEEERVIFAKAKDALTRERSEALEAAYLRTKNRELDALRAI